MKVEVDILGSLSLIVMMVSVDAKQHSKKKTLQSLGAGFFVDVKHHERRSQSSGAV